MNNKDLLKPCPFCGGKAELAYGSHDYNVWTVLCCNENCNASAGWADTPEEAAEAWNRRIEPKPQWIPVTDRLPEIHNTVLVFARYNGQSANSMRIKHDAITRNFRDSRGEWIYMGQGYHVEAWMPLPEPYKEERND